MRVSKYLSVMLETCLLLQPFENFFNYSSDLRAVTKMIGWI